MSIYDWSLLVAGYEKSVGVVKSRYGTLETVLLFSIRIITLASVIMAAIVGNGGISLELASGLGLAVAITAAVAGALQESMVKVEQHLITANNSLRGVMRAKLALMKINDAALADGKVTQQEYAELFGSLSSVIADLSSDGKDEESKA